MTYRETFRMNQRDFDEENQEKISPWKTWLIKKLLTSDSSKEEILNLIA